MHYGVDLRFHKEKPNRRPNQCQKKVSCDSLEKLTTPFPILNTGTPFRRSNADKAAAELDDVIMSNQRQLHILPHMLARPKTEQNDEKEKDIVSKTGETHKYLELVQHQMSIELPQTLQRKRRSRKRTFIAYTEDDVIQEKRFQNRYFSVYAFRSVSRDFFVIFRSLSKRKESHVASVRCS